MAHKLSDVVASSFKDATTNKWFELSRFQLSSGELFIADPSYIPGMIVELEQGAYIAQVMLDGYGGEFSISRLQIIRDSCMQPVLGKFLGEVSVGFSRLTFGDRETTEIAGSEITSMELAEPFHRALETESLYGFVPWDAAGSIVTAFIRIPDASGCRTWELKENEKRVGVEVVLEAEETIAGVS